MRFVAGSHKQPIVPHFDTHAEQNLLTRGQEIEVEVDEADATDVVLRPGQVSLHHGHLFHASNPNGSDDRRIGIALRYITPSMSQRSGIKPLVAHVSGTDEYGHFTHAPAPQGRLLEADFERCRNSGKLMREVLFEGAPEAGRELRRGERGSRCARSRRRRAQELRDRGPVVAQLEQQLFGVLAQLRGRTARRDSRLRHLHWRPDDR